LIFYKIYIIIFIENKKNSFPSIYEKKN
jgi:hypothetical protein